MASNKEILEAQRYNRRRLVTAFASGTPGGRELESKSPFVPLIVGAIVVAIMLGVAAVISRFAPTLPQDWENSTLIVVKGTGARYYTIEGTLRPVTNITSARLLSEAGQYKTSEVAADTIEGINRGSTVGITNIPDDVPQSDRLHSELWFSCALPEKTHTWVATSPQEKASRGAALVENQGSVFLVSHGLRHRIPEEYRNQVMLKLGLESLTPVKVSAPWISLFEQGSELKPLGIENAGTPVSGMPEALSSALLGSLIDVSDGNSTRTYVVTGPSTITPLSETGVKMYELGAPESLTASRLKTSVSQITGGVSVESNPFGPADWPQRIDNIMPKGSLPCAGLQRKSDGSAMSALYSMTTDALVDVLPTGGDKTASNDQKLRNVPTQSSVLGGSGALVRATSGGSLGEVMLVSDLGTIHGLGTEPTQSLERLGYSDNDVHTIPASWTALIPEGPVLDPKSAWDTVEKK